MPEFSVISQDEKVRALVQDGVLERAFHDALFPKLLYRSGEMAPREWPQNIGDTYIFTGTGLMETTTAPLTPGEDPDPKDYPAEQWETTIQQYANSIDSHMPTARNALADFFYRNAQQLGLNAAMTLDTKARNTLFNAAMSGWTVADGAVTAQTTLAVKNINGFTRARNPTTSGASKVRFASVSSANKLAIIVFNTAGNAEQATNVTGFTADNDGDEFGPGTLTLDSAVTCSDRDYVIAVDRSYQIIVGGGNKIDSVGPADILKMSDVREAISRFWVINAPEHPSGYFHCHIDPFVHSDLFSDNEFQRITQSLPEYYTFQKFVVGTAYNTIFFRNSRSPKLDTVAFDTSSTEIVYNPAKDDFGGELTANGLTTGQKVSRTLFTAYDGCFEYWQDTNAYITEAGLPGRMAEPTITNNGITVPCDRLMLYFRAPQNRLGDKVACTWKFVGSWVVRTDAATGDAARYKRVLNILSAGR